jgi:hypothetical protein
MSPVVPAIPMNLVTFTECKEHLRVDHDMDDAQIDRMRRQASGVMINYLKVDVYETAFDWVDEFGEPITNNIPPEVIAATLLTVGAMYENRDGDAFRSPQPLSQAAMDLVWRHRGPAMA